MKDSKKQLIDCRSLFDSLPNPGGLLDSKGNFILATKAFEKLTGKKAENLIGTNIFKHGFFESGFKKIALENMKKSFQGKDIPEHDFIFYTKNKKKIIARTKSSIVFYQGKKSFLFILQDVTEQRELEKKLLESEKKFKDILINSSDIIWEFDKKEKITFISGKVKEILGYQEKELLGKTLYFLMEPEEKKRVKKIFRTYLEKKGDISDLECTILTKSGKKRIFLINGAPILDKKNNLIGYRGVEKDITDIKVIKDRFRELFNKMKSGVAIYEISDNGKKIILTDFNKAAEKIDNKNIKEIKGKELLEIFPEAKELGIYGSILRVWRNGESEFFSSYFKLKSGIDVWRDNFIYRLPSGEVVVIYEDVSETVKTNRIIGESERKFRKIFEASPEAIAVLDKGAKILDLNHRITEWLGYTVEEVRGKSLSELPFLTIYSRQTIVKHFTDRMRNPGKEMEPYEVEFISKKGEKLVGRVYTRAIESEDERLQDLVMISNVTKEKQIELAREARQEQLEKMNRLMVGRELKMVELKEKIKKLEESLKK